MTKAKEYNPLQHSVVQALLKADACNRYEVERGGYVHCLLKGIVDEIEHVYWNWKQEQFSERKDWQFLEIAGFEYRRYCWDDCDCGAESPVHAEDCPFVAQHYEWNSRRLSAISDPMYTKQQIEDAKARGVEGMELAMMFCSKLDFSSDREEAFRKGNPHPPCECGASKNWKERDYHLPTCSPTLPNMKFEDVRINWYKYLGRGTSCNVDWTEKQWREWYDRAIKTISLYDVCMQTGHQKFRDEDADRKPFSTDERVQCSSCAYCLKFGANEYIRTRKG